MSDQKFRYRLSKGEWINAALVALKGKPLLLLKAIFFAIWLLMFSVIVVATVFSSLQSKARFLESIGSTLVMLLFVSVFSFVALYEFRKRINKTMQPDWEVEVEISFDSSALTISRPGISESRYFWPSILKLVDTSKFGLIHLSKDNCIAFPKRALPPDVLASLDAYLYSGRGAK